MEPNRHLRLSIHARDCECVCEINANTKIIIIVIERTEKGPTAESSLQIDGPLLQNLALSICVSSSAWLTTKTWGQVGA